MELIKDRPFTVLGVYVNDRVRISFRCNICRREWRSMPTNIIKGRGCPSCCKGKPKKNENRIIEDHGEWVGVDVSTSMHPKMVMLIDKHDMDMLCRLGVGRILVGNHGYAICRFNKRLRLVHGLLIKSDSDIDHKNGNKLDNRRSNLRKCCRSENIINTGLRSDNTSGYTGVGWDRRSSKYRARINVKGKEVCLGMYAAIEDAVAARRAAELKYYGEFSPISPTSSET